MCDKTINNLISKEKKVFLINVEKYKEIITGTKTEETCVVSEPVNVGCDDVSEWTDPIEYCPTNNADVISLLTAVLSNQQTIMDSLKNIETRMTNLEKNHDNVIIHRSETLAQNKMVRECKVLIKRVHKSLCRITGESDDGTGIEIASALPISTFDACQEVEESLKDFQYETAMKTYLFKLKGSSGTLDNVLRCLFDDAFTFHYNFDGKVGKRAFMEITLVSKTLFDVFQAEGLYNYNKDVRRYIDLSHNRYRQRSHHEAKKSKH